MINGLVKLLFKENINSGSPADLVLLASSGPHFASWRIWHFFLHIACSTRALNKSSFALPYI